MMGTEALKVYIFFCCKNENLFFFAAMPLIFFFT